MAVPGSELILIEKKDWKLCLTFFHKLNALQIATDLFTIPLIQLARLKAKKQIKSPRANRLKQAPEQSRRPDLQTLTSLVPK